MSDREAVFRVVFMAEGHVMKQNDPKKFFENPIAIRLKIQTKSSHKTHRSQLLRLDFVNLKKLDCYKSPGLKEFLSRYLYNKSAVVSEDDCFFVNILNCFKW